MMSCDKETSTLAAIGLDIFQLFNVLENATITDWQGLAKEVLIEQQQRFDLWATNIGLHQKGHASLDYRFRDASTFHQYCQTLLEDLLKTLETCKRQFSFQVFESLLIYHL
jgi:hypothetical protein